jgi:SAM-dependent methyltransferase
MQLIPPVSPYFDDRIDEAHEEPLALDRGRLLEAMRLLGAAATMAEIRGQLADLKARIADEANELHTAPGVAASVAFARGYLDMELDQIAASYTVERARYYVERFVRGITEVRTGAVNDINLNRWKEYEDIYTDSLWLVQRRDGAGAHAAGYWGNFIPQIPHQMMRRYTRPGEWVLDPFAGSGTTLIEARRLGRNSVGVELQASVADRSRALVDSEPNRAGVVSDLVVADSMAADFRALLGRHGQRSAQLAILHPPYYDIIKFSDDPRDLSNAGSVDAFVEQIGRVVASVTEVLDPGRYLALVIGDKYAKCEWIPLGFQTMNEVLMHGFSLKSIIVKNFEETTGKRSQKELWKYRALAGGFYVFKHEYIFVFRKR